MFKLEYALDTYSVFNFTANQVYEQFAISGRFVTALIGRTIKVAGFTEYAIYLGSYILALICVILSQYKIYKIIKNDVKSKIFQILIPILIVVNPFSIELFLFIEKGIMWFGVLMAVCAVEQAKKYFETNKKRYIVFGMILMFVANCSYQGVVGIFVAISLVYILKYSTEIKEFFRNNIVIGVMYGIPAVADFWIMKMSYPTGRISGEIVFSESINKIFTSTVNMAVETYQILPKYMLILSICFTFACFCCKIYKGNEILKFFYILIGTTIIAVLPQAIQPTASIWFVPRSTYTFGAIYGILLLYLLMLENEGIIKEISKTMKSQIIVVSCILLITQIHTFVRIVDDRYKLNEKDQNISMKIVEKVKEYEETSGNEINKIQIYSDQNPGYTYDGIFATGDINVKAYMADWSTEAILEYYLKRELKQEEQDENTRQKFLEKDWNEFNVNEQVILQENTLTICRF